MKPPSSKPEKPLHEIRKKVSVLLVKGSYLHSNRSPAAAKDLPISLGTFPERPADILPSSIWSPIHANCLATSISAERCEFSCVLLSNCAETCDLWWLVLREFCVLVPRGKMFLLSILRVGCGFSR